MPLIKNPDQFNQMFYWKFPGFSDAFKNLGINIVQAQVATKIMRNVGYGLFYAIGAGLLSAVLAAMVAYALTILKVPHANAWFIYIFIGNLFPFQMFLIPLYLMVNKLGLYDTLGGMLLIYTGICIPFATFVFRNYSRTLPLSCFEAANIDGASSFQAFYRLFLPMTKPAILVCFLLQFTWTWNDLLFGLILTERHRPIMTAISKLAGQRGSVPVPTSMAGALLASIPTIALMLSLQKQFLKGFSMSADK
jgi:multiple sugar transport system permease protein